MGTPVIHKKNLSAALNNCAFVSTEDLAADPTRPFEFLMDASMLGVGVGFDTKGRGQVLIVGPKEGEPMTIAKVKEMVDRAIAHAEKGTRKFGRRMSRKHTDADDRVILYEKDFEF